MKKTNIIALVAWMCLSLSAMAQGTISGRVYDSKSGQAVEYATVAVLNPKDSSLVTGTVSDERGAFTVKVNNGRYIVRVSFIGYTPYLHPTAVVVNEKNPKVNLGRIELTPGAVMMDEVVVTAERTLVEYQLDKRVVNVDKNLVAGGGSHLDVQACRCLGGGDGVGLVRHHGVALGHALGGLRHEGHGARGDGDGHLVAIL